MLQVRSSSPEAGPMHPTLDAPAPSPLRRKPTRAETARANGARSRGPFTDVDKARSRTNALKHGLRSAEFGLLPDEDADVWETHLARVRRRGGARDQAAQSRRADRLKARPFPREGEAVLEALITELEAVEDPRDPCKVEHRLIDILVIAVCAVLGQAESFEDMADYGRCKHAGLRRFLALPNGIPSHDTFRRVFMLIDPDAF